MPKATRRHTTKRSREATDPVLKISYQIEHLWDAHHGAEIDKFAAKDAGETSTVSLLRERCDQITEWRDALELVASYTVATSMAGVPRFRWRWLSTNFNQSPESSRPAKRERTNPILRVSWGDASGWFIPQWT
jgi:hypothetical protein